MLGARLSHTVAARALNLRRPGQRARMRPDIISSCEQWTTLSIVTVSNVEKVDLRSLISAHPRWWRRRSEELGLRHCHCYIGKVCCFKLLLMRADYRCDEGSSGRPVEAGLGPKRRLKTGLSWEEREIWSYEQQWRTECNRLAGRPGLGVEAGLGPKRRP